MISLQNLVLIAALLYFSAFPLAKAAETKNLECTMRPSAFLKDRSIWNYVLWLKDSANETNFLLNARPEETTSASAMISTFHPVPNTQSFQSRIFDIDDQHEGTIQIYFVVKRASENESEKVWLLETYSNSMDAPTIYSVRETQTIRCK